MIYLDKFGDELYKLRSIGCHDAKEHRELSFFRSKEYWALHYVQRGSGTLILRKQQYDISAGMFFLTPPHEPVNYYSNKSDPWRYFFFAVYPDSILDVSSVLGFSQNCFVVSAKHPNRISLLFEEFFASKSNSDDLYFFALCTLNKLLSIEFSNRRTPGEHRKVPDIVKNIKEIMLFNYKNAEFSVNHIAEMLHMNPSRLSRIFKSETGETPISHLVNMRLDCAAAALKNHSCTVNELCNMCGFNDEHYFMKRFKRKFGLTVTEYRRSVQ